MFSNVITSVAFGLAGGFIGAIIYFNSVNKNVDSKSETISANSNEFYIDDIEFQ